MRIEVNSVSKDAKSPKEKGQNISVAIKTFRSSKLNEMKCTWKERKKEKERQGKLAGH